MATLAKDQHGPGKEKRGTSPSYPRQTDTTTHGKRSPSAPSPSRPPGEKHAPSTTPSEKRIPNYLKPTMSSAPTHSIQGRTQPSSSCSAAQKPTLNRRRSFDKPPSPNSRLQRSHTLIKPMEKINLQSSSNLVTKTNSSLPKPHKERFLKAHRDVGNSHSVVSSNKKRTTIQKQNADAPTCAAAVSTKAQNCSLPDIRADTIPVVECHQEDQQKPVSDVEEERDIKVEESNNDSPSQVSVMEEAQKQNMKADTGGISQIRAAEPEKTQNQEIQTYESSSVLENQNEFLDVHMEEAEEEVVEEIRKDESRESHQEEIVDGDDKEGEESAAKNSKDNSAEKTEEAGEGSQRECKDREEVEEIGTETKTQMENMEGKNQKQGKKETQAYNDVIEETASKLLEKRKNKVKALVGAFETVISLQEPEA